MSEHEKEIRKSIYLAMASSFQTLPKDEETTAVLAKVLGELIEGTMGDGRAVMIDALVRVAQERAKNPVLI